jgi:hypothetical protein
MKKYIFYWAAALTFGLTACSDRDAEPEITVEQTSSFHDTIIAQFDRSDYTRVSVDGLLLKWSVGDCIGVVYERGNDFSVMKYTCTSVSDGKAVFSSTPTDAQLEWLNADGDEPSKTAHAFYPYSDASTCNASQETFENIQLTADKDVAKACVPMTGRVTTTANSYTFQSVGALFALTVYGLTDDYASISMTHPNLDVTSGTIKYLEKTFYNASSSAGTSYTIDLTELADLDGSMVHTFYFPLPFQSDGSAISGLKFSISPKSGSNASGVSFTLKDFTPKANAKYTKEIKLNAVDEVNQKMLQGDDNVSVDLSTVSSTPVIKIPCNQDADNDQTVTIALNGCNDNSNIVYTDVKEDTSGNGAAIGNVNLVVGADANDKNLFVDLPNSNVTVDGTSGDDYELDLVDVFGAKSLTVNQKINSLEVQDCQKVTINEDVERLTLMGFQGEVTLNASIERLSIEGTLLEVPGVYPDDGMSESSSSINLIITQKCSEIRLDGSGSNTFTVTNKSGSSIYIMVEAGGSDSGYISLNQKVTFQYENRTLTELSSSYIME